MAKKWIQQANLKKGSLHKQLEIPSNKKIPITLLRKISKAEIGETITNPTSTGKSKIKVTTLLKKRAVLALTLRKF